MASEGEKPRASKGLSRALKHGLHLRTGRRQMARHPVHVELLPAVQHGGHNGDADAASDIPGQVHQPRGRVVFLLGQKCISRGVDRNEQKCQTHGLQHSGEHDRTEINSEVEAGHVKQ